MCIFHQFFLHQRATPMSIYVSALYTGTLLAPLVGAYIYGGMGVHAVFVSRRRWSEVVLS